MAMIGHPLNANQSDNCLGAISGYEGLSHRYEVRQCESHGGCDSAMTVEMDHLSLVA